MKKVIVIVNILLVLCLCFSVANADTSESKYSELWKDLKDVLKTGIDYEQYFHVDMSSNGFDPYTVFFTFDFRSGNQGVGINIDKEYFMVSTYQ